MDEIALYLAQQPGVFAGLAVVLGLLVGSFLNVVIYRLPVMMDRQWRSQCQEFMQDSGGHAPAKLERFDLLLPGSACPHCGHAICAWENIPVLSYIFLGGKCSQCKKSISIRYPVIEAATAVFSALVAWKFGFGAQALWAMLFTWALIALTMIDYDHQLLPDSITLPFVWLGLLLSIGAIYVDTSTSILGAAVGYVSLWTVFHVFKWVTGKEGMGFGDFKLLAMIGAWIGWQQVPVVILLSSFVGAVVGLGLIAIRRHHRDKPIPFGPYLAAAGWISLMWGQDILDAYLRYASASIS